MFLFDTDWKANWTKFKKYKHFQHFTLVGTEESKSVCCRRNKNISTVYHPLKSSSKIRKPIQLQICNAINMHAFPNKVKSKSHQTKIHSACNQKMVLRNGLKLTLKQKRKTKCTTHQTKLRITTYIGKCDKGYKENQNKMKPNSWNTK